MVALVLLVLNAGPVCKNPPRSPSAYIDTQTQKELREQFFWINELNKPRIPVCHVRVTTKLVGEEVKPETIEEIAEWLDIPLWVLEKLNNSYDLKKLAENDSILVPAVLKWKTARHCWDPIRYANPAHPPPRPNIEDWSL